MSEFQPYRCVSPHQIHLGGTEPPEYVQPQEILLWNGMVVQRESGETCKIANFRAMINAGWMVPAESEVQTMKPRSSRVEMHEAAPRGPERQKIEMPVVADEERDLGSIGQVRQGANKGEVMPTHTASDAGQRQQQVQEAEVVQRRRKKFPIQREGGDDGVVVGRIKRSAKSDAVEIGKNDSQVKREIESSKGIDVERYMGRDLDSQKGREVLMGNDEPQQRETQFANDGVTVGSGGSSIGGAEAGTVVGKVGQQEAPTPQLNDLDDLREWANGNKGDVARLTKTLFRKYDAAFAQAAVVKEHDLTPKKKAAEEASSNTNGFDWDMNLHWKKREKLVRDEYHDELNTLLAIQEVETSKGVLKAVDEMIANLEG